MNNFKIKMENRPIEWMGIMLAFLLLTPIHIMAQSTFAEQSANVSSLGSAVTMGVGQYNQEGLTPFHFETSGQDRLSLQFVKLTQEQESNRINQVLNEDDEEERRGFLYRNRYIIAGAAVAVGAGTYLLLKSDGSGSPSYLPVPPGRP